LVIFGRRRDAEEEILWADGDARVDEAPEESFSASDTPAY
jgi:hypothetical protein